VDSETKREGAGTQGETARFDPAAGTVVAGKYRVEGPLGEGGMGVVVLATHVGLDQRVAIKFLLPESLKNKDSVERFFREAKVAAMIRSDYVARVHDVGTTDDGVPYIVMEYLEGSDLGSLIDRQGSLPIEEVCEIALQACEALAEVHAAGIVHRDLKPTNLFVTRRADGSPAVKLLDFGISKLSASAYPSGTDPALTATTAIMGSPSYMSPEQLKSTKEVDQRTDVWALGTVLYEAITGRPAFRGETLPQVCAMIAADDPAAPSTLREGVPHELEQAVLACLRKNPDERETLVDLSRVLAKLAPPRARASLERIEATLGASSVASSPSSPSMPELPAKGVAAGEKERSGRGGGAVMLLVIAAGSVLGVGLLTGRINTSGLRQEMSGATSAVSSVAGAAASAIASALPDLPSQDGGSDDLGEAPLATRPSAAAPTAAPTQVPPQHPGQPKAHPAKPHHAAKPWRHGQ
jgi:serine/threonine-protein kinase